MGKSLKEIQDERLKMLNDIEGGPQAPVVGPKGQDIENSMRKAFNQPKEDVEKKEKKKPSNFDSIINYIRGK